MSEPICHDRAPRAADTPRARETSPTALANAVLRAIVAMATESRRREAEAVLAAWRAGITATPAEIRHAVDTLLNARQVTNPIELTDGGIIVSLTDPGAGRGRKRGK
jgi:hypothetical protein